MNSIIQSLFRFSWAGMLIALIGTGCSPDGNDPDGSGTPKPTLVADLNGFRYEGTFKETLDPVQFRNPELWVIQEYNDSLRVFFTTHDENLDRYRWTVQNLHNGKVTREFEASYGVTSPYDFIFDLNNESFTLYGYDLPNSYITTFKQGSEPDGFYLSKPNNNFSFAFGENYTTFFGSASAIYVHENKYRQYTAPAPAASYVLTGESSVAWAGHIIHDDALSATLFREEIITCFFNATLDKFNYIGIAQGQQTLDTLVVNKNNPSLYYPLSFVYASRAGNTVYLGLKKKKGLSMPDDISVYEMDLTEKIIRPVFKNIDAPNSNVSAFVRGKFYFSGNRQVMNQTGQLEDIPSPEFVAGAGMTRVYLGENRIFIAAAKDLMEIELYSKPY